MKRVLALIGVVSLLWTLWGCSDGPAPKTDDEKTIYAFGFVMGDRMRGLNMSDKEAQVALAGMSDAINNKKSQVKTNKFRTKIGPLMRKRNAAAAKGMKEKGKAFMDKFMNEEGAKKTASGLAYKIVKKGKGSRPKKTDTVKVHYHGTLVDGMVFDSSVERKSPAKFPLNRVIKGWTEGLQLVKKGGKIKLVIPSELAYGDRGTPPKIPGGSTLVFDVELLDIVKATKGKKSKKKGKKRSSKRKAKKGKKKSN